MKRFVRTGLFCAAIALFSVSAYAVQDQEARNSLDASAPFEEFLQITPSDSTTYSPPLRGCIVEVAGDVVLNPSKASANVTLSVLKGQLIPVVVTQILSTGTTATVSCGR